MAQLAIVAAVMATSYSIAAKGTKVRLLEVEGGYRVHPEEGECAHP